MRSNMDRFGRGLSSGDIGLNIGPARGDAGPSISDGKVPVPCLDTGLKTSVGGADAGSLEGFGGGVGAET